VIGSWEYQRDSMRRLIMNVFSLHDRFLRAFSLLRISGTFIEVYPASRDWPIHQSNASHCI